MSAQTTTKNNNTEPSEESLIDVVGGISGTYLARFQIGHIQSRTANFSKNKNFIGRKLGDPNLPGLIDPQRRELIEIVFFFLVEGSR